MEPEEKGSPLPAIMLVITVLSVGTACFVGAGVWEPSKTAMATPKTVAPVPAVPNFQIGEIVAIKTSCRVLSLSASPEVGATDERLTLAQDAEGITELMRSRLLYCVEAKGEVRILGFDSEPEAARKLGSTTTWIQVRLLDGNGEGRAGWVDASCLKRR